MTSTMATRPLLHPTRSGPSRLQPTPPAGWPKPPCRALIAAHAPCSDSKLSSTRLLRSARRAWAGRLGRALASERSMRA